LLNPLLLHEIKDCIYRDVDGFFAKYFEERSWSGRTQKKYNSMKNRHVGGRWIDFPDYSVESAVWKWISGIQVEFLIDTRGMYCHTIRTKELTGGEAARQLDLFVKQRTGREKASSDSEESTKDPEEVKTDTDGMNAETGEMKTDTENGRTDWKDI
jgi:hypothetical protein